MPLNVMKSETPAEARERLMEQTRKEKEGFDAVTEGQLPELTRRQANFVGEEHQDLIDEMHERNDEARLAGTMQDLPDDDSVEWTQRAVKNDPDSSLAGEESTRRGGAKSKGKGSDAKAQREADRKARKDARDAAKAERDGDDTVDGGQA
jgi:hypothetical protein